MLAELLKQHHGEKAGPGPAPWNHVERRRRLADLLAVPARELLAHMLDHLPLPGDHFQGLGDTLPELAQPAPTTAKASRRPRHHHTLSWQMLGEGLARRALALIGGDGFRLGRSPLGGDFVLASRALQFLERELHLVEDARGALRARPIKLALELLDHQLLMRDQGCIVGRLGSGLRQLGCNVRRSARLDGAVAALGNQGRLQRVNVIGQLRGVDRHRRQTITASPRSRSPMVTIIPGRVVRATLSRRAQVARFSAVLSSQSPQASNPSAPVRSLPRRRPASAR
jgi:hypothetical protein